MMVSVDATTSPSSRVERSAVLKALIRRGSRGQHTAKHPATQLDRRPMDQGELLGKALVARRVGRPLLRRVRESAAGQGSGRRSRRCPFARRLGSPPAALRSAGVCRRGDAGDPYHGRGDRRADGLAGHARVGGAQRDPVARSGPAGRSSVALVAGRERARVDRSGPDARRGGAARSARRRGLYTLGLSAPLVSLPFKVTTADGRPVLGRTWPDRDEIAPSARAAIWCGPDDLGPVDAPVTSSLPSPAGSCWAPAHRSARLPA